MASWQMTCIPSGVTLAGYIVKSATEEEIAAANARLASSGSGFRYTPVDAILEPARSSSSLVPAGDDARS
jgi:hypothetical protein